MGSTRAATAAGGVGGRRRLFVDASHPAHMSLNAGADDGNDVTFDYIATLCHTDIVTLGERHMNGHLCDDEVEFNCMLPTSLVPNRSILQQYFLHFLCCVASRF